MICLFEEVSVGALSLPVSFWGVKNIYVTRSRENKGSLHARIISLIVFSSNSLLCAENLIIVLIPSNESVTWWTEWVYLRLTCGRYHNWSLTLLFCAFFTDTRLSHLTVGCWSIWAGYCRCYHWIHDHWLNLLWLLLMMLFCQIFSVRISLIRMNNCSFLHLLFDVGTLRFGVLVPELRDLLLISFRHFGSSRNRRSSSILLLRLVGILSSRGHLDYLMTVSEPWRWHYLRRGHLNELSAGNLGSHVLLVRILRLLLPVVIPYHRVVSLSGLFKETLLFAYFNQFTIVHHVSNGLSRHKVSRM